MGRYWKTPYYKLQSADGQDIVIDVTSSVSAGLGPSRIVTEDLIPIFLKNGVSRVLDFGAGAMRHTIPLLDAGFEVAAVEFEEQFSRDKCRDGLNEARSYPDFTELVWPTDFVKHPQKYDAALLVYVLQVIPVPAERDIVLRLIHKKLSRDAFLFYMSRYNQKPSLDSALPVNDGWAKGLGYAKKSFYTELETSETHEMVENHGFYRLRSLRERGTDQAFLYGKGNVKVNLRKNKDWTRKKPAGKAKWI